jgi:hypothetical protein
MNVVTRPITSVTDYPEDRHHKNAAAPAGMVKISRRIGNSSPIEYPTCLTPIQRFKTDKQNQIGIKNLPTSAKGVRQSVPNQRATIKPPPSVARPPTISRNVRIDCFGNIKQVSGAAVDLIGSLLPRNLGGD